MAMAMLIFEHWTSTMVMMILMDIDNGQSMIMVMFYKNHVCEKRTSDHQMTGN